MKKMTAEDLATILLNNEKQARKPATLKIHQQSFLKINLFVEKILKETKGIQNKKKLVLKILDIFSKHPNIKNWIEINDIETIEYFLKTEKNILKK